MKTSFLKAGGSLNIKKTIISIVFCTILAGCNTNNKITVGQNLNSNGDITQTSTEYFFKIDKSCNDYHSFFNTLYFAGDTFTFSINKQKTDSTEIYFINPATNKKVKPESLKFSNNKIYGFSIIGSLIEELYPSYDMMLFDENKKKEIFPVKILYSDGKNNIERDATITINY